MPTQNAEADVGAHAEPKKQPWKKYGANAEGKIPYPKHVWSPSGGWYAQPANWKMNTAIMGACVIGITAIVWSISAEREQRPRMPEPGRFFPSRNWSKQIIEHEKALKEKENSS
ncbi:hypothetical protein M501DRAFT_1012006 [Patellaria atrata CBS 101060]|uniref:Uncharacterized protein n=1 Tax=Patellaria atrata CBS 101060 TaxID=1346257 RepID=A0A9P4SGQ6_9PEZI|nr:hypothetical protein M501DRAFT_1012006 [Patellaria atrata CBS 101060]